MALSEFELARVKRALDALMKQRRPPRHVRRNLDLGFRVTGQSVEIFEIRPAWRGPADEKHESARGEGNLREGARRLASVLATAEKWDEVSHLHSAHAERKKNPGQGRGMKIMRGSDVTG